jgi:hypothetical protein
MRAALKRMYLCMESNVLYVSWLCCAQQRECVFVSERDKMMQRLRAQAHTHVRRSFATKAKSDNLQEKLVALCRHRGFIFPGSEIYGGLANSFDYGPLGTCVLFRMSRSCWRDSGSLMHTCVHLLLLLPFFCLICRHADEEEHPGPMVV